MVSAGNYLIVHLFNNCCKSKELRKRKIYAVNMVVQQGLALNPLLMHA